MLRAAFQSTPPVKAATIAEHQHHNRVRISIHAAREGGDSSRVRSTVSYNISIHAAREGGDDVRGTVFIGVDISIHAAREGGDNEHSNSNGVNDYFNPRRP